MVKNSKGTGRNPLRMANFLTEEVNKAWSDGSFYEKVSPVTQDLLRFWFSDSFCDIRNINFHEGQKQAILNIIYLYEVLKVKNVKDLYLSTNPEILQDMDINDLEKVKYQHPMFGVKMATGTGKTWVMNALIIWQYLNAKEDYDGFSKNFLIVAPGLIVYNRLLDAFLGKENEDGSRDFESSDFMSAKELFIPDAYENKILGFIQSSVVKKDEISSKVTGDGLIAIANWHILTTDEEIVDFDSPLDNPHKVLENVLPISPGKTVGNSLDSLDNNYLKGNEVDFLSSLDNLVVFNDEAHHIHEIKKGGEIFEVEWQKSLNKISSNKGQKFVQIDFSATPYNSTSGKKKTRHYFPHIIVDFDLKTAIHNGLVKMIAIDKRKEVSSTTLDFKAERDSNKKVIGLSDGQKIMLRAGLSKLNILSDGFESYDSSKKPKMLIMCEDTSVAPFVNKFFIDEGLSEEEIMEIHSSKKGEVKETEWNQIKQQLFNMDQHENPKIIISVLMLREGFDVNNICVIVPLRSSEAPILLEQTIGRGLRLMWREPEYNEIKEETRNNILVKKIEPTNQLDLLSIIEHPKFTEFYDEFIEEGIVTEIRDEHNNGKILGDMITVPLKEDYEDYNFYWPVILKEQEENLAPMDLSLDSFEPFNTPLDELEKIKGDTGEVFESQELTVKTKFGRYKVTADLFNADSYNEFLFKIIKHITAMVQPVKKGRRTFSKEFPMMQINNAQLAELIDDYIKTKLFNCEFDPMVNDNYKILFMSNNAIIGHIIKQFSRAIYLMQNKVDITEAIIEKIYFSEVTELKMRENYSIEVSKSIYERLPYPSNKGGFEKSFIESCDRDSRVNTFLKINEYYHTFASITYIRDDGLLARYYPDFLVKIDNDIYVVETKANKDLKSENVQSKRLATIDALDKINQLSGTDRMDAKWNYVLLSDNTFYSLYKKGASIKEILDYTIITEAKAKGYLTLDDF